MNPSERLFFIALLPPTEIQEEITHIKHHFATTYESRHALKSPPHITLQPPFKWLSENLPKLEEKLSVFAQKKSPFLIKLSGFSAFPPRVIYVDVIKNPELFKIQNTLIDHLEKTLNIVDERSKSRPFSPHVTVAFKDLTRNNFKTAWLEFKDREINFEFTVTHLTLLIHQNHKWEIQQNFPFMNS